MAVIPPCPVLDVRHALADVQVHFVVGDLSVAFWPDTATRFGGRPISTSERITFSACWRAFCAFSAILAEPPIVGATATRSNIAFGRRSSVLETAV